MAIDASGIPVHAVIEEIPFRPAPQARIGHASNLEKVISSSDASQVAVRKFVPLGLDDDAPNGINARDRHLCLREVECLRHARHQHVVNLLLAYFDVTDPGSPCLAIVMDLAQGSFRDYTMGRVPPAKLKNIPGWFRCLASVTTHIHRLGIRHRDIKPDNILVKGENILLADFGISKMGLGKTLSTTVADRPLGGTELYVAPEVGNGSTRGRAADIFSLGAVFLEMLGAYYDLNSRAQLTRILGDKGYARRLDRVQSWMEKFEKLPACRRDPWSRKIVSLCRQMLHPERDERPSAEVVYSNFSDDHGVLAPCGCKTDQDVGSTASQKLLKLCREGSPPEELKEMLSDERNRNTIGAIHEASKCGKLLTVESLLNLKEDVNLQDYSGQTALHCAAGYSHDEIVSLLLERGARPDIRDVEGQIALHCAAGHGNTKIVERLLVNNRTSATVTDVYRRAPLHYAARRGHDDTVTLLLEHEADVTIGDDKGRTALHLAAGYGSRLVVEMLVNKCPRSRQHSFLNQKDKDGCTALHFAAKGKQSNGEYVEVIRLLLDSGANKKLKDDSEAEKKAADYAAESGFDDRVEALNQSPQG